VIVITQVADQSIDDVGQTLFQDLRHQSGKETDHVLQPQEETDRIHQSQEEIDHDHPSQGEIGQSRQLGDGIILIDHKGGDQHHERNVGGIDRTENGIMCEHGEGILPPSNLDHRHQRDDGDHLIDGLLIQQVEMREALEAME